nr:M15 family metallopeptidase [Neobacillus sp. Marseille-Q6967]
MRSKNILVIVFSVSLLTGCNELNSLLNKLPFAPESSIDQQRVKEQPENDLLQLESIFFNDIQEVDGKNIIENSSNILALVNKQYFLPEDYIPNDLVRPDVTFSFGEQEVEKSLMRTEAADALEKMFTDAKKNGIELYAVSGYRSYDRQRILFDAETNKVGMEKAMEVVAIPGSSEHQSGLAMDISSKAVNLNLVKDFEDTVEGKWLAENAHRFGFILRYPKGKENITNYIYEPWHFRYVGEKAAKIIYDHDWTLEEYFNQVKKI